MTFPLATIRDLVPYAEGGEGYRETADSDATEAVRVCYVPWSISKQFEQAILPLVRVGDRATYLLGDGIPATAGDYVIVRGRSGTFTWEQEIFQRVNLHRLDPEAHPRKPWLHAVRCVTTGIGSAKMDATTGQIVFRDGPGPIGAGDSEGIARIEVTYRMLPYKVGIPDSVTNWYWPFRSPVIPPEEAGTLRVNELNALGYEINRYVSREFKPASESFTVPAQQLQDFYGRAGALIAESMPKIATKTHVVYTWHMVPQIPLTAGLLRGHVHARQRDSRDFVTDNLKFDLAGLEQIEGTGYRWGGDSLYMYPEIGPEYPMADGVRVRDIKYHVLFRLPGHNMVYRPGARLRRPLGGQEFPEAYRNWVAVNRKFPFATGIYPDKGMHVAQAPGWCLFDYGNLHSLFALYVDHRNWDPAPAAWTDPISFDA